MNTLSNDKFDFDDEDAFTEEELADLESLSDDDVDLDFNDDFEFDDIDLEGFEENDWNDVVGQEDGKLNSEAIDPATDISTDIDAIVENEIPAISSVIDELLTENPPDEENMNPEMEVSQPTHDQDHQDDDALFANTDEPLLQNQSTSKSADRVTDEENQCGVDRPIDAAVVPPPFVADQGDTIKDDVSVEVPSVVAAVASATIENDYIDEPQEGDHIPVPRINISVFCETQATSALVEASAADRRLAKAHVTILMGGIKKAAQHFQQESTPNLLIIETVSGGQALFDGLSALAEVCDPSTKVIIIGAINDIHLYRNLMSRGISEYLITPQAPVQITRAIASLYVDPSAPPIGRSIVFVGSRGGVGSSTICHNVAWAMAERHKSDTVILDLDLAFGTASLDFEQDPSQGLAEALLAPERLDDVLLDRLLQKCTDRLSLFAAPNVLDHDYDLPASAFEEVLDLVRKGVPNLVVDLPHAWTAWTRHVLQTADDIVITATPDLSSFRNAKNLIESVKTSRANDAPPYLILNQMGVPKRPEIPPDQFAEALEIEPAVVINWEPQLFGLAATNAEPIFETGSKSKAASAVDHVASLLLGIGGEKVFRRKLNLKSLFRNL